MKGLISSRGIKPEGGRILKMHGWRQRPLDG
jgi:hypothetical protein